MRAATAFTIPPGREALEPPEARGLARDEVRLLVARDRQPLRHVRFRELPRSLRRGDLVVVNTSDTEPAAVDGQRLDAAFGAVVLHVSGPRPGDRSELEVVIELRTPDGRRIGDGRVGERIALPRGVTATLLGRYDAGSAGPGGPGPGGPGPGDAVGSRLWRARIPVEGGVLRWLRALGRPIRYSYLRGQWPLAAYRTLFATAPGQFGGAEFGGAVPGADEFGAGAFGAVAFGGDEFGSAEMPSAGRPFTPAVLDGLRARGVDLAAITLHTGMSSLEADEVPLPERYRVPAATAAAVNATRAAGGRVIAVGTTVTRALETVADDDGRVHAGAGWTGLVLGPERPARVVRGLITGWHEPAASHLLLLEAVAGPRLVGRAYAAALDRDYRWHEFGDSCLLLP